MKTTLVQIAAIGFVLLTGCQSHERSMEIICDAPSQCGLTTDDTERFLACVDNQVSHEEGRKLLDWLGGGDREPQIVHRMFMSAANKAGLEECPAATLLGDSMSDAEAFRVACDRGMECLKPGTDYAECIDRLFAENTDFAAKMKADTYDERLSALDRAWQASLMGISPDKVKSVKFPECALNDHFTAEHQESRQAERKRIIDANPGKPVMVPKVD